MSNFYKTEFGVIVNMDKISYVDYTSGDVEEFSIVTGDSRIYISKGDYELISYMLVNETPPEFNEGFEEWAREVIK